MVFDGFDLYAKKDTKKKREEKRQRYIKKRNQAKSEGRELDYIKFKNYSMTIQKKHVLLLMDYLRFAGVEYVVSPYEADAQLAYMHKIGQIDYVITEDSDLVLYHCENIINKLNQSGYCELLQIKNNNLLYNNSDTEEVEDFVRLTQEQKIWMSLMVGCDYLEKVRGVGLKRGIELIQNVTSLKSLFQKLKEKCKRFDNSKKYKTAFKNCELVFKYQKVYNPFTKEMTYFQEPDEHMLKYMQAISNLSDYVGGDIADLQAHVKGDYMRAQVPKSERLSFDFASLEYKVDHRKFEYTMNPISNLVSSDSPHPTTHKDDSELYTKKIDRFYENVNLQDEPPESSAWPENQTSTLSRVSLSRTHSRGFRRSRSNDLPSPNSKTISIESLKKGLRGRPRKSKVESNKISNQRIAEKRKIRAIIAKESQLTTESIMQDIIEATLTKADAKVKSNRSTRVSTKATEHVPRPRERKQGFARPQRRPRKTGGKYGNAQKRFGSQIIQMGDLLEAEDQRQKDFSVNISYHTLCLKNDEEQTIPPQTTIIYSKDRSLRRKRNKNSKILKYSQNPMDMGSSLFELDELELDLSQEPQEPLVGKRGRRANARTGRRDSRVKRVKTE